MVALWPRAGPLFLCYEVTEPSKMDKREGWINSNPLRRVLLDWFMSQLWQDEIVKKEYLTRELISHLHLFGPQICIIMVMVGAISQRSSSLETCYNRGPVRLRLRWSDEPRTASLTFTKATAWKGGLTSFCSVSIWGNQHSEIIHVFSK